MRRCEPPAQEPRCAAQHRRGDRELERRRAPGNCARAFHAAPASAGEALDVDAGRAREAARERSQLRARGRRPHARRRRAGATPRGRPKTSSTCADERRPLARNRRDPHGDVAAGEARRGARNVRPAAARDASRRPGSRSASFPAQPPGRARTTPGAGRLLDRRRRKGVAVTANLESRRCEPSRCSRRAGGSERPASATLGHATDWAPSTRQQ